MTIRPRIFVLAATILIAARVASADCAATLRPATSAEKKIYADGFALFQRMAPAAPAGWSHNDSPKDNVLTEVCADGPRITRWGFSRSYSRTGDEQQRLAATHQQVEAVAQRGLATRKANEAKIAEIDKQIDAATKKLQAAMAAKKYDEIEVIYAESEKLMGQKMKLMGVDDQQAAIEEIDSAAARDVSASFSVVVNETHVDPSGFKPMATAVGQGYRLDSESRGNPRTTFLILLGPAGATGQTAVRIDGDTARAEALLKSATLR